MDTDAFQLVFYNVNPDEEILKSVKLREDMIKKYGKKYKEVLDTYFLCDEFDSSTFPKNDPLFSNEKRGWFGLFKKEEPEKMMTEVASTTDKGYIDNFLLGKPNVVLAGCKKDMKENITIEMMKASIFQNDFTNGFVVGPNIKLPQLRRYNGFIVKEIISHRAFKFCNDKVYVPSGYDPENGDFICLSWGHPDIPESDLVKPKEIKTELKKFGTFPNEIDDEEVLEEALEGVIDDDDDESD
jgi:hypothetical protein